LFDRHAQPSNHYRVDTTSTTSSDQILFSALDMMINYITSSAYEEKAWIDVLVQESILVNIPILTQPLYQLKNNMGQDE